MTDTRACGGEVGEAVTAVPNKKAAIAVLFIDATGLGLLDIFLDIFYPAT